MPPAQNQNDSETLSAREYEQRHGALESRVAVLEVNDKRQDKCIDELETKTTALETRLEVLKTQVATYAALGALAGGGVMSILIDALQSYLKH